MSLLRERTALVTGGANGIGRAIVARFADEGARVAVVDREEIAEGPGSAAFRYDLAETAGLGDARRATSRRRSARWTCS